MKRRIETGNSREWAHTVGLLLRLSAHCDECSTRPDPPFACNFFLFWFFSILLRHYKALFPVQDVSISFFLREGKRARSSFI